METIACVASEEVVDWAGLPREVFCKEIVERNLGPLDFYCLSLTSRKWLEICGEIKDFLESTNSTSPCLKKLQGKAFFQHCILTGRLSCVEWGAKFVPRENRFDAVKHAVMIREPLILNYLLDEGFPVESGLALTLLTAHHGCPGTLQVLIDRDLVEVSPQIINVARNGNHGDYLEYLYNGPLRSLFYEHVMVQFNINLAISAKANESLKTLLYIYYDLGNVVPISFLDEAVRYRNAEAVDILSRYLTITFKFAKHVLKSGDKDLLKVALEKLRPTEIQVRDLHEDAILYNQPKVIDYLCELGYGNPIMAEELVKLALRQQAQAEAVREALKRNHFPFPTDADDFPKSKNHSV